MQRIKGKTSYKLLHEFKSLRNPFCGNPLWAWGYFVCSSGNITDKAIKAYIEQQDTTPNAEFRVHDDA